MYCTTCKLTRANTHIYCFICGSALTADHKEDQLWAVSEFEIQSHRDSRLRDLKEFLEQDRDNPYAQKALADGLFHIGQLVDAEAHYRLAMELDPENIDFLYGLGVVLYYQSRITEASKCLKKVLKEDPEFSAAHYRLGLAQYHLGEFENAVTHLRKCASLTPDYEMAHYHLGVVYARMDREREAIREFGHQLDKNLQDAACPLHLEDLIEGR